MRMLISGAIDATEWVGPWNDTRIFKILRSSKILLSRVFIEPGSMLAVGMNKSWWEGLSQKHDQTLIQAAAAMENDMMCFRQV